jgi:hypothetical protein
MINERTIEAIDVIKKIPSKKEQRMRFVSSKLRKTLLNKNMLTAELASIKIKQNIII